MILPLIYLSVFVLCFVLAQNMYDELLRYDYNRRPRLLKFGLLVGLCSMAVLLLAIDVLNLYERLNWLSIKINLL